MIELKPPLFEEVHGAEDGPTVAVIVGVHGNEKGPQLEWEWLKKLQIKKGTLHLVFANPTACEANKRFININLNRRFGQNLDEFPEDRLARSIESVLDQCEASIDLHMYNEGMDRPFVICNPKSNQIAARLPANYIVTNFDDSDSGGTDDYMAKNGKIGICFETGSVDRPEEYSYQSQEGARVFLASFGMIDHPLESSELPVLVKYETKFVEGEDIKFTKDYASFDEVTAGEVICIENGKQFSAKKESNILFPRPNNPVGTEAYYLLEKSS